MVALRVSIALGVALVMHPCAYAAAAEAGEERVAVEPAAAEPARRTIEEIVVTAQKTEQSLQDVPISVTAVTGDFIGEAALNDLTDVVAYVPNVRVDTDDPGSPQVFIRGFGTNTFNPSFEPSVGFVQDEIFLARGPYFTQAMFDIERVEVLRGPQGTLFGKNTAAGVFNVTSNGPTEKPSADLVATLGSYDEHRLEGGVGGMINDWLGARVAFLDWHRDGRLHNTLLDREEDALDQHAGRLKLRMLPTSSLDLDLTGTFSQTKIPFWAFQLKHLDADTRDYLDDFDPRVEDDPLNFQTSMDTVGVHRNHSATAGGRATWRLGEVGGVQDLTAVAVLGVSELDIRQLSDLDFSPANVADLFDKEDYKQTSLELRATGTAGGLFGLGDGLQFVGGLFLFRSNYHFRASIVAGHDLSSYLLTNDAAELGSQGTVPGFPVPRPGGVVPPGSVLIGDDRYRFDFVQDTTTIAPFGQMTLDWRSWSLVPGIRFNWESKDADSIGEGVCASKVVLGTCVMESLLSANDYAKLGVKRDEFDVSPKVSLLYHWTDDVTTYAGWARGYKSGGIKSISFSGEPIEFEPEKSKTVEVGVKSRLFEDTLQLNLALFRTEFENLQVLAFNGVFLDVKNAASATSQGMELDGSWLTPYEPLSINGSVGLLHARYDSYPGAPAPVSQGINELQDLSGKKIAFAPDRTVTLTPTLTYPVWRGWPLVIALDVLHVGEQFTDTDLDPETRVPAHTTFSLRTSLSGASGLWTVTVGVKDLTDVRELNQVTDTPFFPGTYAAQQPAARVVFGGVRLRW